MNMPSSDFSFREQITENPRSSLEGIEKECWALLLEGAMKGKSPLHTFVLGTKGSNGIEMRTLVLRKVEKSERSLYSHTDLRSPKALQLKENSSCSLLFYDPIRRIQIRVQAEAILHLDNKISEQVWQEANMSARKTYLSKRSPGEMLLSPEDGLPEHLSGRDPQPEESETGLVNFLVIEFKIKSLDWLFLNSKGHRRARIDYAGNGIDTCWVNP
jgi:3-hydroxyisobutyrate dehydrogenase